MSRPDGWTASPELTAPVDLRGLRFTDHDIERDYRAWRAEHVRSFTRFAMYAGAGAAVLAWFAVLFGALAEHRGLALAVVPLVGSAAWTRSAESTPTC
jgi:hypothetical protein